MAMAGKAIESMQCQMLIKTRQPGRKPLERGGAHELDVFKAHVVVDQREICSLSSFEKRSRRQISSAMRNTDVNVSVEPNPVARFRGGFGTWAGFPTSWRRTPHAKVGEAPAGSPPA